MNRVRKIISLDGEWKFAYTKGTPDGIPKDECFEARLPVPAYWDDCKGRLKYTNFWSRDVEFNPAARRIEEFPLGGQKPPDASLPYILGTGWYKRCFSAGADWKDKCVTLYIGGAMLDAWVWINGEYIGTYYSCGKPFELTLDDYIKPENELVIAVSNTRKDRTGCSIRGYKGKSAGITRSVELHISNGAKITDCYVRTNAQMDKLLWDVSLRRRYAGALKLRWSVFSLADNNEIAAGETDAAEDNIRFETDTFGIGYWSDRTPELYELRLVLISENGEADTIKQSFGMRYASREGTQIFVNNTPVFLRGTTDHAYFPETCTVPTDTAYYMRTLRALKEAGFNWMRFHTTIPPEECMEAADRLGMYIQTETQNGFSDEDFENMLMLCRKHPSVILYCCGNEVPIDDIVNEKLERMSEKCHSLAPDCLFDPMEALLKVECFVDKDEPGYTTEPYEHNEIKLNALRQYSDVFAAAVWVFSYDSMYPDMTEINRRMSIYKRPCLIHEAGIFDTYLNLDLENRYENSRIGKELYTAVRSYIKEMGMLDMAPIYYKNSCLWMKLHMKFALEKSRRCPSIAGYDFLGAIDCHWHRSGYAVGVMNEFYELKAGFTAKELQQFNGESILVCDAEHERSLFAGQRKNVDIFASLYGGRDIKEGVLTWALIDDKNDVRDMGTVNVSNIKNGELTPIANIRAGLDSVNGIGEHIRLSVTLNGGGYMLANQWDYWVFKRPCGCAEEESKVLRSITAEDVEYMNNGGRAILLGSGPFPKLPLDFQITPGGRTAGNCATVIHDSPLMRDFPHDGFCDWQFAPMFRKGEAIQFNELDIEFKPIVEIVSTYKYIRKQAAIFELGVGRGGMLVCGLNIESNDPAAKALFEHMKNYVLSEDFSPQIEIGSQKLLEIIKNRKDIAVDFTTDECYDAGGHIKV